MSKSKKSGNRPREKQMQLVVTVAKGEVLKVAALSASGQPCELSEKEFAHIAGEHGAADLEKALKEAYAAGMRDALDESIEGHLVADKAEHIRRTILREAVARRGARRLMQPGARRRGSKRVAHNGVRMAPKHENAPDRR
jgi:hypothetical protein